MDVSVLRIPEGLPEWHLVAGFLRLRRDIFIRRMAWPLIEADGMEFEQYDTPSSVYVVAHDKGEVLGGARLLRTTSRMGNGSYCYSYMIRDAYRRLLPGLPSDLCAEEPPVAADIWELTRLASNDNLMVAGRILTAANAFLRAEAARECLFLGPPAFMRMARGMGYAPRPLGKVVGNADGRFLAFSCGVL